MQAFEVSGEGVRRHLQKETETSRTLGRTVAGQIEYFKSKNKAFKVSGQVSGAVRMSTLSAVCPVGVSIGHPTPDTRTHTPEGE